MSCFTLLRFTGKEGSFLFDAKLHKFEGHVDENSHYRRKKPRHALHLSIFEQLDINDFFSNLLDLAIGRPPSCNNRQSKWVLGGYYKEKISGQRGHR